MSDTEPVFLDSNIWLYAFLRVQDEGKHDRSKQLIKNSNVQISVQVIGEVCNTLLKKSEISEFTINKLIEVFYARFKPVSIHNVDQLLHSCHLRQKYNLSHWDSWIVVAAFESGAKILYSEDMQDGLVVEGSLRIVNPFKNA
jgi:predicted nucleic acid-binding protein